MTALDLLKTHTAEELMARVRKQPKRKKATARRGQKYRDYMRAYMRESRHKNPVGALWARAKDRADRFGLEFNLKPGTITIWDNRRTMHNAINDYHGMRRHMRRLTSGPTNPI